MVGRRVAAAVVGVMVVVLGSLATAGATPGDVTSIDVVGVDDVVLGPDDAFWGTATAIDAIVRIDPDDPAAYEPITDSRIDRPGAITLGRDGRLWFTNHLTQRIGALDPTTRLFTFYDYEVNEFGPPDDLVGGPDGRVWFVDSQASVVGAMTTADGTIETFPDPDVDGPVSIAVGPGGTHLWFTSAGNDAIGRMDPQTEQIETFTDPSGAVDSPYAIAPGPDGDLWFSTNGSRGIGRADGTTGAVSLLADPTDQRYGSVAAGSDGEVWAVNINRLTRVDPDTGDLDTYVLPVEGFDPNVDVHEPRLVTDADGRLWLTRYGQFSQVEIGAPGETDTTDPTVVVRSPADGHSYLETSRVVADYECTDAVGPTVDCQGGHLPLFPVADGEEVALHPTPAADFSVFGRDAAGNTNWVTNEYSVDAVCRGQRATVLSIYRGQGYGRVGPGRDIAVADVGIYTYGGDDLICTGGFAEAGRGDDEVFGRSGRNRLFGRAGADRLVGGAAADELDGGAGFDVCIGGRGADTFVNCERVRQE